MRTGACDRLGIQQRPSATFTGDGSTDRSPSRLRGDRPSAVATSKYSSNFGQRTFHLRICRVSWDFTDRCFASFGSLDQRLPEQRRNRHPSV